MTCEDQGVKRRGGAVMIMKTIKIQYFSFIYLIY